MLVSRSLRSIAFCRLPSAIDLLLFTTVFLSPVWCQTHSQSDAPASSQTPQADQSKPPVAVNPKPCEITVTPSGPTTNTCSPDQQSTGTPPSGSSPSTTQTPGAGADGQPQQQGSAQAQPATRVTKAEARELFHSVDDILAFASQDTGLPIKRKVKRKLIAREQMEKYIHKGMRDDKDSQRLVHEELVLQKFGFIPPGYNLRVEFLRLLGEQVAAYYEPKNKTVNLLDWVQPDIQRPVLAHELTHALQDQTVDLLTWPDAGQKDDKPLPDQQELAVEEEQAARQCVTEGQAMITLYDYSLAPLDKNVVTAPDMVNAMRAGVGDNSNGDSPVFAAAPMFLRESLMMPYSFGSDFVRAVLVKQGKQAAFTGMLLDPPVDTRQVMQPETYMAHQVVAPLTVPDLDRLAGPGYERYDFGAMGEFDIYLLAKQYGGNDAPKNYYPHWRGGYYYAAHAKTAPKDEVSMLYFSRWDSAESANAFAKLYGDYLPKRYKKAAQSPASCHPIAGDKGTGCPVALWDTNEGKVRIEVQGNDVLITEDFDDATVDRAHDVLLLKVPAREEKRSTQYGEK
jgi:hypothetical protein